MATSTVRQHRRLFLFLFLFLSPSLSALALCTYVVYRAPSPILPRSAASRGDPTEMYFLHVSLPNNDDDDDNDADAGKQVIHRWVD